MKFNLISSKHQRRIPNLRIKKSLLIIQNLRKTLYSVLSFVVSALSKYRRLIKAGIEIM